MLELQQKLSLSSYTELYDLIIPKDNLLRQIKELVDFSFIYEELVNKYSLDNGRNAISPIRMFKYLLLKTIYDLSDIDVVERSKYDMSFKFFLDMTPEETVINPSSLTKFRKLRLKDMNLLDMLISKTVEIAIEKGIIKYLSGKPEFIRRGYFNDVDIAFMVHAGPIPTDERIRFGTVAGHNGVIRKRTTFHGKSAHAGSSPHLGINALNAATTANMAINSLRETFKEEDKIRIHSIITKGGSSVNAVPDEIIIESYIRGASVNALKQTCKQVNRVIASCAAAFGANATIEDEPGSEPMHDNKDLNKCMEEVVCELFGDEALSRKGFLSSSTDMGDISVLFPAIHAYAYGATGNSHGKDYYIVDPKRCCVDSATVQVCMIRNLLSNNAEKAKKVVANYKPQFSSMEEYTAHKNSVIMNKTTVTYNEDGTIKLDF